MVEKPVVYGAPGGYGVFICPGSIGIHFRFQPSRSAPRCRTADPYFPQAGVAAEGPFLHYGLVARRGRSYPEFDGKIIRIEIAHTVPEPGLAVGSVEIKRPPDNAVAEGYPVQQRGVVGARNIFGIAVA